MKATELQWRSKGAIVLVVLGLMPGCSEDTKTADSTADSAAVPTAGSTLKVFEEAAAWMVLNNSFDGGGTSQVAGSKEPPYVRNPQDGVLIQLGYYKDPVSGNQESARYDAVMIDDRRFDRLDGFYWVNVVSEVSVPAWGTPSQPGPLGNQTGLVLFPNSKPAPCHLPSSPVCCTRKLHPLLEPEGIITYWTGSNGYSMSAAREETAGHPDRIAYQFELKDPVKIEVHKREADDTFTQVETFATGTHNIRVTWLERVDKHNQHDDPPWP